ncbi:MAG: class B sortase, partial [Clostridia bacterium]|nr:class B sortase [Clostridia bacterium]
MNQPQYETEQKKSKKIIWWIILILSVVIFAVSFGLLAYRTRLFGLLPPKANPYDANSGVLSQITDSGEPDEDENLPEQPEFLTKAITDNPDTIGWIQLPGSGDSGRYADINYPIMQSSSAENENFYLTHDFEKQRSHDAAIYVQRYNHADFSDPNTIIYGHDLADRTMFTALRQYTNKSFFDKNDVFYIAIPGHVLTYKVYSAFVYDDRHLLRAFDFDDNAEYQNFLDITLNPTFSRQYFVRSGVSVTTDDRIVTLSTCTPNKNDKERFLVVGVLTN